ncbi:MAG: acetyl-coenzyme A synthetase, partial [Anaerolineae bacterium]|nr:acetyl-coenzyme A synthetase [Anaerolineae bacterium]
GFHPKILDEVGNEIPCGANKAGILIILNPWPGQFQSIWGDQELYVETYYAKFNKDPKSKDWRDWPYIPGDAAMEAEDGYFRILGRMDDVINVAGHRLGTKELESACLMVDAIAEASVVPVNDEIKGKVPDIYISLKPGFAASDEIKLAVVKTIEESIGKIARPKNVWIVPDMPKTRSGKIMRRVLASISNNQDVGDITTLANPDIVEEVRRMVQGK